MKRLSHQLSGAGEGLARFAPQLSISLKQAEVEYEPREYLGIVLFSAIFYFVTMFAVFIVLGISTKTKLLTTMAPGIAGLVAIMVLVYQLSYPQSIIHRRVSDIEKNLIFALRNMVVQVSAGVPLFNALVFVARGDFGLLSSEFKKAVREIQAGEPQELVLEKLAIRNPSTYFRRVITQLTAGLHAGANVANVLTTILDYLSGEQKFLIRKYGATLNPLAMFYTMLAVIFPALGITLMLVLGALPTFRVNPGTFVLLIFVVVMFQIMYIGIMRVRRPALISI